MLKRSRRTPQLGDIFVMLPPDGLYLYGRVIRTDADAGFGPCNLIYIYHSRSKEKRPVPELLVENLLVPPMMTNKMGWADGYFEFLENRSLMPGDRLPQHCFWSNTFSRYYDEHSNVLPGPTEPVGRRALRSYVTIDYEISVALGIPPAPD